MSAYLSLPLVFLHYWFIEAPFMILRYFGSVNTSYLQLTSLRLLVRTFFQPLKNEYRKGLVGFSIGMGIVFKTILISVSLIGLTILLGIETLFLICFILAPIFATTIIFT